MSWACDDCLYRGRLIGALTGRIENMADRRSRPVARLLTQSNEALLGLTGLTGHEREEVERACREAMVNDRTTVRDGGVVCIHSEFYPPRLQSLVDPPRLIYFTGPLGRFLELTHNPSGVAVVGSRRPSALGCSAAIDLGRDLAAAGVPVISGLAKGIDACAHEGAVSVAGPVIAVLGCGADEAYPRRNSALYRQVRTIGTVISELPWGVKPRRWTFPARNRIMAALAELTVVVEAAHHSGSLITADFALDAGREVGAMPGPPGLTTAAGSNQLLRECAHLIRHAGDALDILGGVGRMPVLSRPAGPDDPELAAVLDGVTAGSSLDAIALSTGLEPRDVRIRLSRLERAGHLRRNGIRGYVRATPPTDAPNLRDDPPTRRKKTSEVRPPRLLTIAGSDSGGGAGIQADLKAFANAGAHGMSAITAITVQNTVEVRDIHTIPPEIIVGQVAAVAEDIGVDAVKIGMLGNVETIEAVDRALDLVGDVPVVLDPVMVAESGAVLLDGSARDALRERIVPRATVITPNLPEARVLAEGLVSDDADAEELARALHGLGPQAVVVTGGHRERVADVFFDGERLEEIGGERHPDGAAHGSGCTHSSTLAAHLGSGLDPLAAARVAKRVASQAVRDGLRALGDGAGPVDVFGLAAKAERARSSAPSAGTRGGEVS
jgi:hydroxymethylpyrimidine/phosphomethylpyrimidine kinase